MSPDGDGESKDAALSSGPCDGDKPIEQLSRRSDVPGQVMTCGGLSSVRFTIGLYHLKGLFQPKCSYDSMIQVLTAGKSHSRTQGWNGLK